MLDELVQELVLVMQQAQSRLFLREPDSKHCRLQKVQVQPVAPVLFRGSFHLNHDRSLVRDHVRESPFPRKVPALLIRTCHFAAKTFTGLQRLPEFASGRTPSQRPQSSVVQHIARTRQAARKGIVDS